MTASLELSGRMVVWVPYCSAAWLAVGPTLLVNLGLGAAKQTFEERLNLWSHVTLTLMA